MRQLHNMLLLTLAVSILASCVTQKRRDELSGLGKLYHNTTAKYNGYFNANELLIASVEKLSTQLEENYKTILPVYDYAAVDNAGAVAPDLDKAIEKVSVVVNLHRQSHWTDDCYLLVGKAQYLKQDYEAAEETLRYMVEEFSPEKMAEKGKKSKAAGRSASGKGKSVRSARGDEDDEKVDITQLSEKEKRKLLRRQEKERKKYNKELRQKKKQEQRRRKRARKQASKGKPRTPEVVAPQLPGEAPADEPAPAPGESTKDEPKKKKDRKKKDEDPAADKPADQPHPESYFLKHRPAYQEGVLWLARTFVERGRYDEAMRLILQLERDPKTFDDIRAELAAVKAYYFLEQQQFEPALAPLEDAIAAAGNRRDKARYAYIIAQIHQRAGRERDAYAAFDRVLTYGPSYAMEFNGRIAIIDNGWRGGSVSAGDAKNQLERMLRDDKNIEYKDQIYYAMAEIDLATGDREEGIRNLERSLASSQANRQQRAESYLRLANLYFEQEAFVPAQRYFDSTMTVLPSTDERYAEVKRWRDNLADIARNLEIVAFQDSILRIADMSPAEQRQLASRLKKERDAQRLDELARSAAAAAQPPQGPQKNNRTTGAAVALTPGGATPAAATQQSTFFAYDDRSVKRGKRDFFRKWGDRPLEDNWRRRGSQLGDQPVAAAAADTVAAGTAAAAVAADDILADVPKTESEKLAAQLKLQEAMFNLGVLYRERLNNNQKCIETLEELLRRFQRTNFQLDAWYNLYLAYNNLGQPARANEYANLILDKYSSSVFAKVLRNPNYAVEAKNEENRLARYYEETYAAFQRADYQAALQRINAAPQQFGSQNPLQPKFALLGAMCAGNLQGKEAYVAALNDLIARYPASAEQTRAREILRLLGEKTTALPGAAAETATQFEPTDDQLHYILIVFNEDISLNDSKVKVSNYHLKYHKLDKLSISNIYLGTDAETRLPILVVRRFKNKGEAMAYFNGVQKNKQDFVDQAIDYELFAVSQNNYREILRSKSLNGYREFFNLQYLGQ